MERLARTRARIESIRSLLDVVRIMRSLAAVRMQRAEESLPGARDYAAVIAAGLADAIALAGADQGYPALAGGETRGAALLVFCSEHGFVGGLNHLLMDAVGSTLTAGEALYVIGSRGMLEAAERGLGATWSMPMTAHRDGVPALARHISFELYRRFEAAEFIRLEMLFARTTGIGRWHVERQSLLPIDLSALAGEASPIAPISNLPGPRLIERLAEEYFFAELARGAMEALAGENAARLAAMSAAHDNIEHRLEELERTERRLRQEEITTELLDVITGSEAMTSS